MKTIIIIFTMATLGLINSFAGVETLLPTKINTILAKVSGGMSEMAMLKEVRKHYPKATSKTGPWSGHTGILEFKLDKRYSLPVTAISKIDNHDDRSLHKDLTIYVYDWKLKRRVDISFHAWAEDNK